MPSSSVILLDSVKRASRSHYDSWELEKISGFLVRLVSYVLLRFSCFSPCRKWALNYFLLERHKLSALLSPRLFAFKVAADFIYIKARADGEQVIH